MLHSCIHLFIYQVAFLLFCFSQPLEAYWHHCCTWRWTLDWKTSLQYISSWLLSSWNNAWRIDHACMNVWDAGNVCIYLHIQYVMVERSALAHCADYVGFILGFDVEFLVLLDWMILYYYIPFFHVSPGLCIWSVSLLGRQLTMTRNPLYKFLPNGNDVINHSTNLINNVNKLKNEINNVALVYLRIC